VIRDNKKVTCILPDTKAVVVEKGRPKGKFPPPFPSSIQELNKYYQFSLANQQKVAGQLAQQIYIKPKDQYRYGHRLWVDVKTGLLLQKYLLNEAGKPLEKFMFTRIEYKDHIPDELLQPRKIGKEFTWYQADDVPPGGKNGLQHWQVGWLPAGFTQDTQREHKLPANNKPLEHMVFSDGLASISVFIEPQGDKDNHLTGGSSMGAVSAHGKHIDGFHVTVVGEVPQIAVRKVCASVSRK
jgi:sigma-E factor negative regulatory protein RseB